MRLVPTNNTTGDDPLLSDRCTLLLELLWALVDLTLQSAVCRSGSSCLSPRVRRCAPPTPEPPKNGSRVAASPTCHDHDLGDVDTDRGQLVRTSDPEKVTSE